MFDIGWSEMLIVGVVALIVVGPKDLPKMFRTIGELTGKARGMAREFQRAMDDAARESGVNDLGKTLRKTAGGPKQILKDAVGFDEIDKEFKAIGRDLPDVRKSSRPVTDPAIDASIEADDDEAEIADHDATLAARNAAMTEVEAERLRKNQRAEANRLKAAAIRARREAEAAEARAREAEAKAWKPGARPADTPTAPAPTAPSASPSASDDQA